MTTTTNETNINAYSDNDNSVNDIAVYVSTSVSNPYTFKITSNKSFSAVCEEDWSGGGK